MYAYETILVTRSSADETAYNNIIERAENLIETHKGKVLLKDKWGVRRMAYPIDGENNACYTYLAYTGDQKAVEELERVLGNSDYVIRRLTIKVSNDSTAFDANEFVAAYRNNNYVEKSNLSTWTREPRPRNDDYDDRGDRPRRKFRD